MSDSKSACVPSDCKGGGGGKNKIDAPSSSGKQQKKKVYIRLTELDGREHEERFQYYEVDPDDTKAIDAWKAMGDRFDRFNVIVSKRRWWALQQDANAMNKKDDIDFGLGIGRVRQPPFVSDCHYTEFHIDKLKLYREDYVVDHSNSDDDDDDNDDSKHVCDRVGLADIRSLWWILRANNAFEQGDVAYRPFFYHIGKQKSTYTFKHTLMESIPTHIIKGYHTMTDDEIQNAFYKGRGH